MAAWAMDGDETMSRKNGEPTKVEGTIELETRRWGQKCSARMAGTSSLFWGLKYLYDGFNSLRTETTLGITNLQLEEIM